MLFSNHYERLMLKASVLVAFFGLLRIGEFAKGNNSRAVLCYKDIQIVRNRPGQIAEYILRLTHFKHSNGEIAEIIIKPIPGSQICPVQALQRYLNVRGDQPGPLFTFPSKPLSRAYFSKALKLCIDFCGLNSNVYKSHSFRIGRATLAAKQGLSDDQIKRLGRWRSNAFLKYIRPLGSL